MTAEIAIMNRYAVALAADSAVTVSTYNNSKIYNTANKLFTLSKYHPVGIMIYGNGNLLGIPWELIIKEYRNQIKDKSFNKLFEYGKDFIKFLHNLPWDTTGDQKKYFLQMVKAYINEKILKELEKEVKKITDEKNKISEKEIIKIVNNLISTHYKDLDKRRFLKSFSNVTVNSIIKEYEQNINEIIFTYFEKIQLTKPFFEKIKKISAYLFTKEIFPSGLSGIVISGFGEKEVFPSIIDYNIETIINSKLKYFVKNKNTITTNMSAMIIPFAQTEMVVTFIEGIDPFYNKQIIDYLKKLFEEYPKYILESIEKLDESEKKVLSSKLKKVSIELLRFFNEEVSDYKSEYHISPIIDSVASLPKPELAEMAEALVNLTSFKRRVSKDEMETVGGPTDVAIISKGDGFVWIKRKHYFQPELNYHFKKNYFRNDF